MAQRPDLLSEASFFRPAVQCSFADETPCHGCSHDVFKIIFEDSVQWAARVCHDSNNWPYELRAAEMFRRIKQHHPEIRAPSVFFKAECPVLYSEWVNGRPLAIWNSQIPSIKRQGFLDNLAEFLIQLWTTPAPPNPPPTKSPYSVWLTESLDRGLRRNFAGTARWGDAINYLIMRSMIPSYSAECDNYTDIGFAHGDLNAHNFMVDSDFQLTGVVDWDWISLAPLPAIVHHPWFIADIPGWNNEGVIEGESFSEDRLYLEDTIKKIETSQHLPAKISTLLCDSKKRLFFQSAFHFKGIYEQFVKLHCPRTEENFIAAKLQLDTVLATYPEWKKMQGVKGVMDLLREV